MTLPLKYNDFVIHIILGYISTIYLVEYEEKILVIDCGCKMDGFKIKDYVVNQLKKSLDMVKILFISHVHPDHSGGSSILAKNNIAAHPALPMWYKGPGGVTQKYIDCLLTWIVARKNNKPYENVFFPAGLNPDFSIEDGQKLPFFKDWTGVCIPGHTTHDMGLYNEKDSIFFASDQILQVSGRFQLPFPITTPEMMKASLNKIKSLRINTLLMAHGGVLHNPDIEDIVNQLLSILKYRTPTAMMRILTPFQMFSPEARRVFNKAGSIET